MPRRSLSVICRTAEAGPRPAAILAMLRQVADEIVVAVDRGAPAERIDAVAAVADRLFLYPCSEPVERSTPWLFNQAGCDWVLRVDDDEIPGLRLVEALPDLLGDESIVHCSLQVRWLYPDARTYLAEWPWQPHYAARLLRRDSRLIRFTTEMHRSVLTAGPGRFVELPLWHADALLRSREERLEKAARYERERPGMRIAGRALNHAFYVPELRAAPSLAPVPEADRSRIEAVLAGTRAPGRSRATVEPAPRDQIVRYWPVTERRAQAGRLELLDRPATLVTAERRTLDVRVRNTGSAVWQWGSEGVPEVRVGSRWFDAAGREQRELEIHTPFAAPLEPGGEAVLPVHVRAPETPGSFRIEIDLVYEHVGWLGAGARHSVDVLPQRRLAVVGDDEAVASVAAVVAAHPEVELVRLRRTPRRGPGGYPEASDLRAYLMDQAPSGRLRFAATLAWRRLRLRVGPAPGRAAETLSALRGVELLVLAGADGPDERRERFARDALVRAARSLRVPTAETRDPEELARRLGRD